MSFFTKWLTASIHNFEKGSLAVFLSSVSFILIGGSLGAIKPANFYFLIRCTTFGCTIHCICIPCLLNGIPPFHMLPSDSGMMRLNPAKFVLHPITITYLIKRLTDLHPPFRICYRIVLIPTSSSMTFPGAVATYFFRRKVSASRILQVPAALFLEFFQKLFAVCRASNKNFSWPRCEIIR